jgi:uncharacterized protein (TIGR02611 family)
MQAIGIKKFFNETLDKFHLHGSPKAKRVIVAVLGGTVLLIGICLIVLPGPAFIVIPAGLAILATEFVWARRWLQQVRNLLRKTKRAAKR